MVQNFLKPNLGWNYVDLYQFRQRLNRRLQLPKIQEEFSKAAKAIDNVKRAELVLRHKMDTLSRPTQPNRQFNLLRPVDVDTCSWRYEMGPGRPPTFFNYCCHGACHWLAVPNLVLARSLFPDVNWSVASSKYHTTVLSIENKLLFDLNYLALQVPADKALSILQKDDIEMYEDNEYHYKNGMAGAVEPLFDALDGGKITEKEAVQVLKLSFNSDDD